MSRPALHPAAPSALAGGAPRWGVERASGHGSPARGIVLAALMSGACWLGLAWMAVAIAG